MNYRFKKVLVTGGAGCIGMAVCNDLLKRGIKVILFDLYEQINVIKDQINDKIDTGNIICQEKISIKSDETTGSLWTKLSQLGQVAILKTLDQLDTGKINYILRSGCCTGTL